MPPDLPRMLVLCKVCFTHCAATSLIGNTMYIVAIQWPDQPNFPSSGPEIVLNFLAGCCIRVFHLNVTALLD